jgi:hypothetical protein
MPGNAIEIAKLAIGDTNIGGVYVAIDLPGDLSVGDLFFSQFIGDPHQFGQWGLVKEPNAFF